jgi:glycosyltransferase involved in cell wall biosynthesis
MSQQPQSDPNPLISVIVPVYNTERYLQQSIDSILAQTDVADAANTPLEIIAVDDGSTDNSAHLVQQYVQQYPQVSYLSRENGGIGAARNTGIAAASGEYLAFLDSDDWWPIDKLSVQAAVLAQQPDVDLVLGHVAQFISPEVEDAVRQRIVCPPEPMLGYLCSAMLIRRSSFDRVGSFSTTLRIGEYIDWYARATELGLKTVMLPDVVLHRRLHGSSESFRHLDNRADFARLLKAKINRERTRLNNPTDPTHDTQATGRNGA